MFFSRRLRSLIYHSETLLTPARHNNITKHHQPTQHTTTHNTAASSKTKLAKRRVMTVQMISLLFEMAAHACIPVQLGRSSLMIKVVKFVEGELRCFSFVLDVKTCVNTYDLPNNTITNTPNTRLLQHVNTYHLPNKYNNKHAKHTTLVTPLQILINAVVHTKAKLAKHLASAVLRGNTTTRLLLPLSMRVSTAAWVVMQMTLSRHASIAASGNRATRFWPPPRPLASAVLRESTAIRPPHPPAQAVALVVTQISLWPPRIVILVVEGNGATRLRPPPIPLAKAVLRESTTISTGRLQSTRVWAVQGELLWVLFYLITISI